MVEGRVEPSQEVTGKGQEVYAEGRRRVTGRGSGQSCDMREKAEHTSVTDFVAAFSVCDYMFKMCLSFMLSFRDRIISVVFPIAFQCLE